MNNPIIQEVRAAREALAAKSGFDLRRIYEDAVKRQAERKTVTRQSSPGRDGIPARSTP